MCNKIYHIENHSIKERKNDKIFKYLSNCKFSYQLPKRNKVLLYDSLLIRSEF